MKQLSEEQHLIVGRKLKTLLIRMIIDKWNDKDFTSLKDVEQMATDILQVFQFVSAHIQEILHGRTDSNWN